MNEVFGTKVGECAVCGKVFGSYNTYLEDTAEKKLYCSHGSCIDTFRADWIAKHFLEIDKLMLDHGVRYRTDG